MSYWHFTIAGIVILGTLVGVLIYLNVQKDD
jgi:hypothetical protein